jgi:diguanylate cyclase (GGDEF)-like protein
MAHEYSNTIDFDAARLQRHASAQRPEPVLLPITLSELRQHLTLLLQSSLLLDCVLELFFREVQRLVALDGLHYCHPDDDTQLELGRAAQHMASYNLKHGGEALGELCFLRAQRFSEDDLAQLESLLGSLLYPLRNSLLYRAAVQSSLRDPLTGVGNRIAMEKMLQREVDLARRNQLPLSVLMIDIDHFKRINDNHGHGVGDEVLTAVATELRTQLRNVDMLFRYGGEEFLVVLSNTNAACAALIGERLRQSIADLQPAKNQTIRLSISSGCATLLPDESSSSLLQRADRALYFAKHSGRNRLCMAAELAS